MIQISKVQNIEEVKVTGMIKVQKRDGRVVEYDREKNHYSHSESQCRGGSF